MYIILNESMLSYNPPPETKEFLKRNNINLEDLYYLGKGDFGEAYQINDGKVLKITGSKSEYEIALYLKDHNKSYSNMADIYSAEQIGHYYYIIMELLDTDSEIEDMFLQVSDMLSTQDVPLSYISMFDHDEYNEQYGEPPQDVMDFFDQLYGVVQDYNNLGLQAPDIRSENLGYDKNGNLKAFDIDDKAK